MKSIKCLLGMHSYSQVSAEVKVVDKRYGYLVCRVRNCCIRCGKSFEDIIPIPIPEWLNREAKMDLKKEAETEDEP